MRHILLLMAMVCMLPIMNVRGSDGKPVRAITIRREPIVLNREISGQLEAADRTALGFEVPGRIVIVKAQMGAQVQKGDILAELDPAPFENALKAAQEQSIRLKVIVDQASQTLRRVQNLFQKQAATQTELERAETGFHSAEAAWKAAKAQVDERQRQVEQCRISAPYDCSIIQKLERVGDMVSAGKPVYLVAGKSIELVCQVPETMIDELPLGSQISVHFPMQKNLERMGTLIGKTDALFTPGQLYSIRIGFKDLKHLKPGMMATAKVQLTKPKALALPLEAIVNPGGSAPQIIIIADGKAHYIPIEILFITGRRVVIQASIEDEIQVVTAGHAGILEGDPLEVLP